MIVCSCTGTTDGDIREAIAWMRASDPLSLVTPGKIHSIALRVGVKAIDPDIPVILVTGHGDVDLAVAALKDGVYDFIPKPYAGDRLVEALKRASEKRRLMMENRRLREAAALAADGLPLIGPVPGAKGLYAAYGYGGNGITFSYLAAQLIDALIGGGTSPLVEDFALDRDGTSGK